MTRFQPFVMERMMSMHEQDVEYNLSESGVHPLHLGELIEGVPGGVDRLLGAHLNYAHANGTPELRDNIASMYDGATSENVLVTVGAIEANLITMQTLVAPGERVVVMLPNYMQIWGVGKNFGFDVATFDLREDDGWAPDLDQLHRMVTTETKLIAICNPNNPTGRILTEKEMDAIVAEADRVGAWILADEVYAGAERSSDEQTPSFYGRYDKVVAVGSLSKAYGLPGLRVGWAVAPDSIVDELWARHEYTTLSATMLSNQLAALALSDEIRPRIIERTRRYIRDGFGILEQWLASHGDTLRVTPPDAAAIAFVGYDLDVGSTRFVDALREKKSVLIVPGDHFGVDRHIRVSFGLPRDYLLPALERIHDLIEEFRA